MGAKPDSGGAEWRGWCVEVRAPASTSNLGAGFDCFGLALQLYLTVRASVSDDPREACRVRTRSDDALIELPRTGENLIYRAMRFAAERERVALPPVRLAVRNQIPLKRGLGSSAAAIVCGIRLCALLGGRDIAPEVILRYAAELEGHADNVGAALYGGWVVTCDGTGGEVICLKRRWPPDLRVMVVIPHTTLDTAAARAALPATVTHADAVHNLQRAALFCAAVEERAYDLLWEAMRDRLHQERRQTLVPGLSETLATPRLPGLVGLALSGAGPSVLALVRGANTDEIGEALVSNFRRQHIQTSVRLLEVDRRGLQSREPARPGRGADPALEETAWNPSA